MIAGEVVQLFFAKLGPAIYAEDRLEQTARAMTAHLEPVHKFVRLVPKADTDEHEHREGRVPEQGVAVVPVVRSLHSLRQRHGGGRNQSSGGMVDHEFEGEGRPVHYFPPTATIGAPGDPPPPVVQCTLQQLFTLSSLERLHRLFAFSEQVEDETSTLALLQFKSRDSAMGRTLFEWHRASKTQGLTRAPEDHPALDEFDGVLLASVVEGRTTIDIDWYPTPDDPDVADQIVA